MLFECHLRLWLPLALTPRSFGVCLAPAARLVGQHLGHPPALMSSRGRCSFPCPKHWVLPGGQGGLEGWAHPNSTPHTEVRFQVPPSQTCLQVLQPLLAPQFRAGSLTLCSAPWLSSCRAPRAMSGGSRLMLEPQFLFLFFPSFFPSETEEAREKH